MSSYLVSALQDRVRLRCALPAFTADTNINTTDILTLVQESVRRLSGMMAEFGQDAYFASTVDVTTTPGTSTILTSAISSDFGKLLKLDWKKSASEIYEIHLANLENVGPQDASLNWDTRRPEYRFRGGAIEFFPTPAAVHTVTVRYSTGLFPATSGASVSLELGWDEWVVLDCCCKVRQRQEKDYSDFAQERAQVQGEILRQARRDRVGFTQTRDVSAKDWVDPAGKWWTL